VGSGPSELASSVDDGTSSKSSDVLVGKISEGAD